MRVIVIGGFLGSGKTSTVIRLGKELSDQGKKVAVIVNEIGEIGIDGDIISKYGLETNELTSGCICCSLKINMKTTITLLMQEYTPDILLIEPTGIAFPQIIKHEIELMNLKDTLVAPLVTLIDGSRFKQIMKEVKHFSMRQIIDAEILGINKIDLMELRQIPIIEEAVKQLNPQAKVIKLSTKVYDEHWEEFLRLILEQDHITAKINQKNVDNLSKEDVNSIDSSGITSYATEFIIEGKTISDDVAITITKQIMDETISKIKNYSPEFVGHIKMFLENNTTTIKMNITAYHEKPLIEIINSKSDSRKFKILSAVSSIEKENMINIIDSTVKNIFSVHSLNVKKNSNEHPNQVISLKK